MKLLPASLSGRLYLAAVVFIVAALVLAGIANGLILRRFVIGQIDQRLDRQIETVSEALLPGPGGTVGIGDVAEQPPFDRPLHGWYWQVRYPGGVLPSPSLAGVPPPQLPPPPPFWNWGLFGLAAPADGPGPNGQDLHWRMIRRMVGAVPVTVAVSAPADAVRRPMIEALFPLFVALAIIGLALLAAMFWQVRVGLRPLRTLRERLSDIRAGRSEALPEGQPCEIAPLAEEVNLLLAENAQGLARARRHLANLAHGLKTPLATMQLALERTSDPVAAAALEDQVAAMDRLVRHHLARARTAALEKAPIRARSELSPRLSDIVAMMGSLYAERRLRFDLEVQDGLAAAVEAQDFDEIFGNLLDNACKWAKGRISVSARSAGRVAIVSVEDDGAGLQDERAAEMLRPGSRMDEATPGHGFGLPIAVELAELYGGSLKLCRSKLGGLAAEVTLPVAM